MADKQYEGLLLENLEDLDDITAVASTLPDSKEKRVLMALLDKKAKKNQRKLESPLQP